MPPKGFPRPWACDTCRTAFTQNTPTQLWCGACADERNRKSRGRYERRRSGRVRSVEVGRSGCTNCKARAVCDVALWTLLPLVCSPGGEQTRAMVLESPELVRAAQARW